jgi:anti-anti-sigma factor
MLDTPAARTAREPAATLPCPATITVTTTYEHTVVAIAGDIDLAVTAQVQERLHNELRLRPEALIIDLTDVAFCSSGGLSVLLEAVTTAHGGGLPCAVVAAQRAVLRPARLLRLDRHLPIHPTLADAETWLSLVAQLR